MLQLKRQQAAAAEKAVRSAAAAKAANAAQAVASATVTTAAGASGKRHGPGRPKKGQGEQKKPRVSAAASATKPASGSDLPVAADEASDSDALPPQDDAGDESQAEGADGA